MEETWCLNRRRWRAGTYVNKVLNFSVVEETKTKIMLLLPELVCLKRGVKVCGQKVNTGR